MKERYQQLQAQVKVAQDCLGHVGHHPGMEGGGATHVNLIYDLTPRFRVGVEYMYGTRRNVGGAEGHANRMQFMSMYTF